MKRAELIRKEILLQLYACRPLALSVERVGRDARKEAYDYTEGEIGRELQFLTDEGLAIELEVKGSTERLYRIAPEGVRQFEQNFAL